MTLKMADENVDMDNLIVSLDAKKAFDSVEHSYIEKCLIKVGLRNFVPIFNTLYADLQSDIIINGKITRGYKIKRGVKQGDALSCILFILCIEPLLRNIESNPVIEPIFAPSLEAHVPKAYAYADDVTGTFKRTAGGLQAFFYEYQRLTRQSGLELNADKTEILKSNSQRDEQEEVIDVHYLNDRHRILTKKKIKLNGILLQQDNDEMKDSNVEEVLKRMDKNFKQWTRRSLTTLGKILIAKTYGISQIIFLLQSMDIKMLHYKKLNALLYKFIWNRRYLAAKAPERIKRNITNLPIKLGGLGMLDISELDEGLKLRALGRLFVSEHPMLNKVKNKLELGDFFHPRINTVLDEVASRGIELLSKVRQRTWLDHGRDSEVKYAGLLKSVVISRIISENGKRSIPYFILNRAGKRNIGDLSQHDWRCIRNYVKNQALRNQIELRSANLAVGAMVLEDRHLFPCRKGYKNLSLMTSKEIREQRNPQIPECLFKIGLALTPAESLNWLDKVNKLTSTKHKNSVLRTIHGDIYSNERLFRFGMSDSPLCLACGQIDTLSHKIFECPVSKEIWDLTLSATDKLRPTLVHAANEDYLQRIFAACSDTNTTIITIHAEVLSRLISPIDKPPPRILLQSALLLLLSRIKNPLFRQMVTDLLGEHYAF